MSDHRFNLDFSRCIHEVNNIGSTTYVNVCDGSRQVVEWGLGSWLLVGITSLIFISVAAMLGGLAYKIWKTP